MAALWHHPLALFLALCRICTLALFCLLSVLLAIYHLERGRMLSGYHKNRFLPRSTARARRHANIMARRNTAIRVRHLALPTPPQRNSPLYRQNTRDIRSRETGAAVITPDTCVNINRAWRGYRQQRA